MAKQQSELSTRSFTGSMQKDLNDSMLPEGSWTHAINASNNSHDGQVGTIGCEPANKYLNKTPYDLIGAISLNGDKWVLFSTDDVNSEIGLYDESENKYSKIVNDKGLNFKRAKLITGVSKKNFDCTFSVYFADDLNPDRMLNIDKVPYKEKIIKTKPGTCIVKEYTNQLDTEALRLSRLVTPPIIKLSKSSSSGSLPNGSYQIVIAYVMNGVKVSDYFTPSNVQSVFSHGNMSGSLEVEINMIDDNFDEIQLVLLSTINNQTSARNIGVYNAKQKVIVIDQIRENLAIVPLEFIPLQTPSYDKSKAIYQVNDYMLRVGPYTKPDFNYQPLANKIIAKWVLLEVPADYYEKGGNIVGNLRDESYIYFIRWLYNTAEKSACYPISGHAPTAKDLALATGQDVFELQQSVKPSKPLRRFQVENTATVTSTKRVKADEGYIISEGLMGYNETEEIYPADKPEIWKELCAKNIRLHRMPDNDLAPLNSLDGNKINILGVKFENISLPVDINGNVISSIIGYEILRASREGNKTIVAKGIINNMGEYVIPNDTLRTGLYPNFPFNDVSPNIFLSENRVRGGCNQKGYTPLSNFKKDTFTFHSPETQFRNPYLSATELKIHGELYGEVNGNFDPVYKHPKNKLIRDFALIVAGLVGVGTGLIAVRGKKITSKTEPSAYNPGLVGPTSSVPGGGTAVAAYNAGVAVKNLLIKSLGPSATASQIAAILDSANNIKDPKYLMGNIPGVNSGNTSVSTEETAVGALPDVLKLAGGAFMFSYFFSQGTDQALKIIKALVPLQQYAYQYNAHALYSNFKKVNVGNKRRLIEDSSYLEPYLQDFGATQRVNNLFRSRSVIIKTAKELEFPSVTDTSRVTIGTLNQWDNPSKEFKRLSSVYYASLKNNLKSQYGQLESNNLLPVSGINITIGDKTTKFSSPVMFGGDTYVNKYSEKNVFTLFNDWMHDMPDNTEWDYNNHYNVPHPRYWINSSDYDVTNLTSAIVRLNFKEDVLPNDFASLDRKSSDCKRKVSFVINNAFFYLFVNGVREFFVESEINLAQRDFGEDVSERHYSKSFTDLKSLFRSDHIKSGNYFKYDYSLSVSKLASNQISWGQMLPRDFDPKLSATCFDHYEKRIIYSLPQNEELKKDNWSVFLINNYKDFTSQITAIQSIGKTGAMIFFDDQSPVQFNGVDQLQTEAGVKITIGDGGLFAQPVQATSNANKSFEYGACQDRLSILSTPAGLFWVSQKQNKIFHYTDNMNNIGNDGLKYWTNENISFKILDDFPTYDLLDNPLIGVGYMSAYDSLYEMVYFTKKDYKLNPEFKNKVVYVGENIFLLNSRQRIRITDSNYFTETSWTLSYDVKKKGWISFHNWKPSYLLPSSNHFISVKNGKLWKHNDRHDLFCNYYDEQFSFEIEIPIITGQEVTTLTNIEYQLECYKYSENGMDKFHMLDENFDNMIIYNSEQHSGLLRLKPKPKNDPWGTLESYVINGSGVDVLFSKEENKYRVNEFLDLTKNRGEFNDLEISMWKNHDNGFEKTINQSYINYSKDPFQRKEFRHYGNKIILRKTNPNTVKYILRLLNDKHQKSLR